MSTLDISTLTPSSTPSYDGTGYTLTPGAKRVKYGGDYETRVRRSLNKSNRDQILSWDSLPQAEAQALEDWLENTYGVTKFNITGLTGFDTNVYYVYVTLSRNAKKPGYDTVSVKLERVFA